jgi:molybdopterin/thiamine biosynthesis adenylyltransferase
MYRIIVIGCGSLGSTFACETARRAAALKMPLKIVLLDYDKVEERNIFSQDFLPTDIDKYKAEAISDRLNTYSGIQAIAHVTKVTDSNFETLVKSDDPDDLTVVVDCVDNVLSRQMIWLQGQLAEVPVLHLGMTTSGAGTITWNYKTFDNFPLSPLKSQEQQEALLAQEEVSLPPCMLSGFRSLIFNTSIAGVNSLFIFLGKDLTEEFVDPADNSVIEFQGHLTTWYSTKKTLGVYDLLSESVNWP